MAIVWPAFALVALTAFTVVRLARLRFAGVAAGQVDPRFYKSFRGAGETEEAAVTARHLNNLTESPTLFYAGTAIALAAGIAGALLVGLAWAYVAARVVHSVIHLGPNKVLWRFRAFAISWLLLLAYWVVLGLRLVENGAAPAAA
ncbi:MAG: MAPEG family protein [Steroidobacteraceae bacterium]